MGQVYQKAASSVKGQRIYPSQTQNSDRKANFGLDKGAEVGGKLELILQANKGAEDAEVKKAAAKDSHAILAKILVDPVKDQEGSSAIAELIAEFEANQNI